MPIYTYKCKKCGHEEEKLQKVADLDIRPEIIFHCCECKVPMKRIISRPPNINPDYEPWLDENLTDSGSTDSVYVKSRRHHKQLLKEKGLVQIG